MKSQLVANGDPTIMQVVSSAKDLEVVPLGHQGLTDFVHFLRLLRLTSPHWEYDITVNVAFDFIAQVSLVADEHRLFGMLQVISVPFVDLAVDSLLYPNNLIDQPK